jgi:Ca2+-binding RTX toxin-like protein
LGGVSDTLDGGLGIDTVLYTSSANAVVVDLGLQANKTAQSGGTGDSVGDILTGFENVVGSDKADTITGDNKNNIIEGGKLGDTLNGGLGIDTVSYKSSLVGVNIDLVKTGAQDGLGDGLGDILSGFENIIGSGDHDTLTGDNLLNTIFGGGGSDVINGGNGADVLDGGDGFDYLDYSLLTGAQSATVTLGAAGVQTTVTGTAGSIATGDKIKNFEVVLGGAGNDVFTGNAAFNQLFGGDGDDILTGGAGGDWLHGNNGIDTAVYAASLAGVTVNLKSETGFGGDAEGDILSTIENVTGSGKNDIITGSDLVNKIRGGLGDDVIEGGKLGDTLDGSTGIDTVSYSSSLTGVTINLALQAAKGAQTDGDAAGDILTGFENIIGSAGVDKLTGDAANNVIEGGGGADILDGGKGANTLSYAHDTDGVLISLLDGTATSGDATGDGFTNFVHLTGGSGNDYLTGDKFNNVVTGGLGDDVLAPGIDPLPLNATGGIDVLDGGSGFDTVLFTGATLAVTINLAAGTAKIGASTHTLKSVEGIRGGGGNDVYSALGFNSASKNAGSIGVANTVGDFNRFEGGQGNDSILGNGNTQVSYATAGAGVSVDLLAGTAVSINAGDAAQIGVDDFVGGVNAIQGSNFNDILRGSDILDAENFEGVSGDDVIDGNGGFDRADYSNETSKGITVDLAAGTVIALAGGSAGSDTLTQVEAIRGTDLADTINANGFSGSSANAGDLGTFNEVEGGGGDDFIVGNADTRIVFYHSNTAVSVDLWTQSAKGDGSSNDNVGTDTITAAPHVRGSQFNDTITGDNFSNTLDGQLGDDSLTGLTFGGADTFVYSVGMTGEFVGGGKDTITDFQYGIDKIQLHIAGITSYADIRELMTETGTGVEIDFGGGNSLTLNGFISIANLDANQSDFLFY